MVILLLVHLVQVFVWGAYKKPRELTWMVGVLLLVCTLGLAFTGYLLPWDQKAYWATKVGLGIVSTMPVIGDGVRHPAAGRAPDGQPDADPVLHHPRLRPAGPADPRCVVVHLYLFRLHGVTPPWWQSERTAEGRRKSRSGRDQVWKDGVLALVFLVGLGAVVLSIGRPRWKRRPTPPSPTRPGPNGTSCSCSSSCGTSTAPTRSSAPSSCRCLLPAPVLLAVPGPQPAPRPAAAAAGHRPCWAWGPPG